MPTSKPRIAVIEDAELAAAIEGARGALNVELSKAALVRELALRGWRQLEADEDRYRRAVEGLTAIIREGKLDWDLGEAVRRRDPAAR